MNESLIPRGRNALVARAMANPLATHLMFIDSDILFEPSDVLALLQENVDVIGGGYPKKSLPVDYVINPCPDGFQDDGKVEVLRLGTGFLLIRREVFVRLAEANPHLKYTDDCGLDPSLNPYLYAYFDCGLVPGHDVYMSEDWMFCNRWRDLGGKVFLSSALLSVTLGPSCFPKQPSRECCRVSLRCIRPCLPSTSLKQRRSHPPRPQNRPSPGSASPVRQRGKRPNAVKPEPLCRTLRRLAQLRQSCSLGPG